MKYPKPAITFSAQADLLLARGLAGASKAQLVVKLEAVSYYRLSAYWVPFRRPDDSFVPGTTLDLIWHRYTFDRQLRLLLLDAIERAEVAIRTRIVNQHALAHGPFGYLDRANLPGLQVHEHRDLLERIREEARRSREAFVTHFFAKYTTETDLPLWMACELMTFGGMFTLYRGLAKPLQQALAGQFGVADTVFESWLRALNQARNLCAHHARVWNRVFGLRPQIPRANKHPQWHQPIAIRDDRIFGLLSVLRYLLRQTAPASAWPERLKAVLAAYPHIPLADMGFPAGWEQSPIWL